MDIRKIALQLSWKISPDYKKYNRFEYMELLEENFWLKLDKIDFYWKQANEYEEEFYFLVTEYLYNKALKNPNFKINFDKFIKDLNLDIEWKEKLELNKYKAWEEEKFTKEFLLEFFKKLWFKDVRYNHWTDEKWKDIVMKKINDLWEFRYIWIQAKIWDIDAKANKTWVTNVITQAVKAFANDYDDLETNKRVKISEYFIVTNWIITEKAVDEIMNIEPWYFKNNIHFIDKTKIENLLEEINKY